MKARLRKAILAMLALFTLNASAVTRYVDVNSPSPTPPYTNWPTAATNIQDAVDASADGDEVVVTNGVYASGGRAVYGLMTNRVAIDKPLLVRSVNGPSVTLITGQPSPITTTNGDGAVRCVYVGTNAVLSGFTLTNGHTRENGNGDKERSGGGAWCEASVAITNCTLVGNSAYGSGGGVFSGTLNHCTLTGNSAYAGGGAFSGTLNNCTFTGNSAYIGGGAHSAALNNCTLIGNSASWGGGAYSGRLNNCIVYYNSSATYGPNWYDSILTYSCTTAPPLGFNIAKHPLFVDTNGWSNLRLRSNSPCINAGSNAYVTNSTDLDGNPRIAGGRVDMGAYEFQGTGLTGFTGWLWQHGLRVDGTADTADSDGDTMNNWQEWRADTNPTNALSGLRMVGATNAASGLDVTWQSVSTRSYFLERATNLGDVPPFQSIATNIAGASGTKTYTDTSATNGGPYYYRVGVQ